MYILRACKESAGHKESIYSRAGYFTRMIFNEIQAGFFSSSMRDFFNYFFFFDLI